MPLPINWDKVNHPELVFQRFPSRRSVVYSKKGLVASSQPLASSVGISILDRGGNAADAAVGISAALNVTEPSCCGIGGDAFCLFFNNEDKSVSALNGSGKAPAALTIDYLRNDRKIERDSIPVTDINSVTVPGCAAAWVSTVDKFGSGKVSLADVLEPAAKLAEEGVPVSEINSAAWQKSEDLIKGASPNGNEMLLNGRAPKPGEVIKLPNLAETFRTVAREGKDGFYKGRIAEAIVHLIRSQGGKMELSDLAAHETAIVEPISLSYGNEITIFECPPNGQGITALIALGILEALQTEQTIPSLIDMEHNSAEYLHVLIEALRLAFADSQHYVTDPDVEHVPVNELLSQEYLTKRAQLIDPTKANPKVVYGNPAHSSDTVYFTVTDQWGNACSFIQSNYSGFGTGAIPKGCGFTLQNRGTGFSLNPGHPNALQGGKRPYHTIIPAMVTKGKELFLSYGVMGGFMQPQGHVQVLLNILRGLTAQAALDAPRFCISSGTPEADKKDKPNPNNSEVYLEEGIAAETVDRLRVMGHDVRVASDFQRSVFGRGQVIQKLGDTSELVWAAGSDPRADGQAVPQI